MMLYRTGLIVVDMKYKIPEACISTMYMVMVVSWASLLALDKYTASSLWAWNGAQQIKNAATTATGTNIDFEL